MVVDRELSGTLTILKLFLMSAAHLIQFKIVSNFRDRSTRQVELLHTLTAVVSFQN
jgi:hypothetical protein